MDICIEVYIYIYPIYKGEPGPGTSWVDSFPNGVGPEAFLTIGGLFVDETALGSLWGDGSQQAGLNTSIESFWRCICVEIFVFLLSSGVLGWSQGRPRAVPGACPGFPGASPGVPGPCPGDPLDPRGLWRRPTHPRDPFHKDDSVI